MAESDWKKNINDVIAKWEKKGAPPSNIYENAANGGGLSKDRVNKRPPQRTFRRKRQLRNKEEEV